MQGGLRAGFNLVFRQMQEGSGTCLRQVCVCGGGGGGQAAAQLLPEPGVCEEGGGLGSPHLSARQGSVPALTLDPIPAYQVPCGGVAACLALITLKQLLHSRGAVQTEEWAVHPRLGQQRSHVLQKAAGRYMSGASWPRGPGAGRYVSGGCAMATWTRSGSSVGRRGSAVEQNGGAR